jgi:pseudouridine synthase, RluA family
MKNTINLIVDSKSQNLRIDQYISNNEKDLSRTRVKNLILNKKLKINNIIIENPSKKTKNGDIVSLEIIHPNKTSLKPYNYKLDIIYEDSDLIIINKPAGISMHPGAGNYDKTLVNALMNYDSKNLSNIGDELRPGIVHRIDKDTSGLIVVAKNNISHEKLSKQFSEHKIKRVYQLLIWGKLRPQNGKIDTLIKRSSKNRQLMEVNALRGKRAITNYKTIKVFESNKVPTFSFIECKLETGRTHQIRVHMSYKGNCILGDKKYKKKIKKIKNINPKLEEAIMSLERQFLHAKLLGFVHPTSGKKIRI